MRRVNLHVAPQTEETTKLMEELVNKSRKLRVAGNEKSKRSRMRDIMR